MSDRINRDELHRTDEQVATTTCVNPAHWVKGRVGDTSEARGREAGSVREVGQQWRSAARMIVSEIPGVASLMGRRVTLVVPTVLATIFLMACEINPYEGPEGAPRVGMVGDSITFVAGAELKQSLSDYQTSINGVPGIGQIDGRRVLVQPIVATSPDVLVIELGVNSARESWDARDIPHLEGIMADAADIPCVIWVTPSALSVSYYDRFGRGTMQARLSQMRNSISRRVAKLPNFHLADWGSVSNQRASWFERDGLHNTVAGREAYAAYVSKQVRSLCPR